MIISTLYAILALMVSYKRCIYFIDGGINGGLGELMISGACYCREIF
jgi:hypothetical protein